MKKLISVAALLGSFSTIICCFLPALFVTLGAGATFAGIIGTFPQLIWFSEHKGIVFLMGAVLLLSAGLMQWRAKNTACPIDPRLAEGCKTARSWSKHVLFAAVAVYTLGFFFAFISPMIFR